MRTAFETTIHYRRFLLFSSKRLSASSDAIQWTRSAPISKRCIVIHKCKPTVDSLHGNPIIITLKRLSTMWNANWSRESVIMNTFHREMGWICSDQFIIRHILFFPLFFSFSRIVPFSNELKLCNVFCNV